MEEYEKTCEICESDFMVSTIMIDINLDDDTCVKESADVCVG